MARRVFGGDDVAHRPSYRGGALTSSAGVEYTVYTDPAATTLANIQTFPGAVAIAGSVITVDDDSLLPRFYGPNDDSDTLYVKAEGSDVVTAIYSRADPSELAADIATKVSKATTTAGTEISDGDDHPVKFRTPSGANWSLSTQTSVTDPLDHVFRFTYNYDLSQADRREIDDVAIRIGFESNFQGAFELNVDLTPANGSLILQAATRPFAYTFDWDGTSTLTYKGTLIVQALDAAQEYVARFRDYTGAPDKASLSRTGGLVVQSVSLGSAAGPTWQAAGSVMLTNQTLQAAGGFVASGAGSILLRGLRVHGDDASNTLYNEAAGLGLSTGLTTTAGHVSLNPGLLTVVRTENVSGTRRLGFFGTTPVAKPTGVAVDAAGIHAALVTLGLIAA